MIRSMAETVSTGLTLTSGSSSACGSDDADLVAAATSCASSFIEGVAMSRLCTSAEATGSSASTSSTAGGSTTESSTAESETTGSETTGSSATGSRTTG